MVNRRVAPVQSFVRSSTRPHPWSARNTWITPCALGALELKLKPCRRKWARDVAGRIRICSSRRKGGRRHWIGAVEIPAVIRVRVVLRVHQGRRWRMIVVVVVILGWLLRDGLAAGADAAGVDGPDDWENACAAIEQASTAADISNANAIRMLQISSCQVMEIGQRLPITLRAHAVFDDERSKRTTAGGRCVLSSALYWPSCDLIIVVDLLLHGLQIEGRRSPASAGTRWPSWPVAHPPLDRHEPPELAGEEIVHIAPADVVQALAARLTAFARRDPGGCSRSSACRS